MTMARRCDAAGARSCQRLCRCAAGVLLALAATVAPGCAVEHSPASPCPPGHNRRTSTLSGGMPLDESSGLPSEGMLDGARALFRQPAGLAFSPDGAQVAVADAGNHQIRVVSAATGNVTTVAGAGPGFADGGDGLFNGPLGLAFSRDGTLLAVADVHNFRIRFLENPLCTPRGVSRTVAGGSAAGTADGTGTNAQFREPAGVAFSPDGRWLVVADKGSNVVRMVSVSSGVTTTLAGDPSESGLADGAAGQARFNRPCGVAFSPDGQTVAVADAVNHAVRVIRFLAAADAPVNVTVQTLAGGRNAGFADGLLSSFSDPHGVSFSPDGSLVAVADTGNHAIRIVNVTSGTTTTIGDRAPFSAQTVTDRFGDGAVPTFYRPTGVAFSPDGRRIAVADKGNNAIRTVNLGCIECAAATYKGAPGPADCAQCPSNSTSLAGSQSLADCLCRQGFEMVNGTCLACRAGYFNSVQGSTACTSCPASTYSDATAAVSLQACSPCPQHAFSDAGSNSKTMCLCEAGFSGSPGQDINCSACSQGFYKGANGTASCEPCEAGKYSNTTGASFCADCNAGSYSEILGALSCWPCPAGSFANSSSKNCTECGVGKYSNITGASLCSDCAPGSYSDIPRALSCWPCPAGSFANSSSKNCTECGVGKYSNITGASLCSDCAPGSYSDIPRALSCWPCPAGKYSQPAAATVCAECPVDAFATEGSSECLCNVGYSRSNLSLCAACAPGKYKAVNGSTCLLCPRAQYSSANASSACSLCPPFSTSREGSFDLSDCECNPGYTNAPQDLQSSVNASQDLRPRNMSAESSNRLVPGT
jgi:DNA-binding beta-propeller fold protein YncE